MNDWRFGHQRGGPILQVSPNDYPPFRDICAVYRKAGESLGCPVSTVFLAPPTGEPSEGAHYLDVDDTRASSAALESFLRSRDETPALAVCHRYRSYRVLRAVEHTIPRVVTVAHEFGFFARFQRRLERRLFARNVRFAGVSPAVQAELAHVAPRPLCLPNGIDLEALTAQRLDRKRVLRELGIDEGPFTIGLVGRLVKKKQPELALETLRRLTDVAGIDARLVVIGDGELKDRIAARADSLSVHFCGFLPSARRYLAALDTLLLVSSEIEAFGMVALEAMASRVPVVTGPNPGPQFVMGSVGYYYPKPDPAQIAEAVLRVRSDRCAQRLERRLDRGVERVRRKFSIAAVARRLDQLFDSPAAT